MVPRVLQLGPALNDMGCESFGRDFMTLEATTVEEGLARLSCAEGAKYVTRKSVLFEAGSCHFLSANPSIRHDIRGPRRYAVRP